MIAIRILVTGSEGFIASHLIDALVRGGYDVSGLDLKKPVGSPNYRFIHGDLCSYKDVEGALKGVDVVYHLAAVSDLNYARENPLEAVKVNVLGTANVAEACRVHGAKLIFSSSCHVYGRQEHFPVTEDSAAKPAEVYAATKLAAEEVIKSFGIRYTILRYGTTYGPGMRPALAIHIFLSKALKGEAITVFRPGTQIRQYIFIDDLIKGSMEAMKPEAENQVINLPGPEGVSILRIAQIASELTGGRSPIVMGPPRPADITLEFISREKAKYLLNWEPKIGIQEGLRRTLNWIKSTKKS